MATPKTDDFRLEHRGETLIVTHTPTGASYAFETEPEQGKVSAPSVEPADANTDYAEEEIRKTATELARLALVGSGKP
ncbi:hypothetical protein A33M_1384 [Rhodovulum sp. PH10]|uniref:hypothetical protein n=1 Tax=Rhodovulum sp. PH10 TaxID=1187851 RepID=UPI00027C1F4F|nr:hypothetical protein [Rhodovulum sp. PH10]EJW09385.1 hypothetical protein A33M_1384 [Rhodovulum sp. PH10]